MSSNLINKLTLVKDLTKMSYDIITFNYISVMFNSLPLYMRFKKLFRSMKKSNFRTWVEDIWKENCEECREWRETPLTLNLYWNKYKWWLKREFKYRNSDK